MPATAGKLKVFHEGLIDYMLANPSATTKQLAEHFSRHPQTISMIINNDMFKTRFHHRRKEYQSILHEGLAEQTLRLASATLNELTERVENNPTRIPFRELADLGNNVMERLGYGVKPISGTPVQVNTSITVSPEILAEAKAKLRAAERVKLVDITPETSEGVPRVA
jgi:hypothetical protein